MAPAARRRVMGPASRWGLTGGGKGVKMKMVFKLRGGIVDKGTGYKTKQRQAILDYLMENKDKHVTAASISEHLEKEGARVGTTTIYRHLDKLLEQGLVRKYMIDGTTSSCFQYADQQGKCKEHFHLKCGKCGKLIHMNCSHFEELYEHILEDHGFEIDFFRTVFYGICRDCKKTEEDL